jgi:hypothetical protein
MRLILSLKPLPTLIQHFYKPFFKINLVLSHGGYHLNTGIPGHSQLLQDSESLSNLGYVRQAGEDNFQGSCVFDRLASSLGAEGRHGMQSVAGTDVSLLNLSREQSLSHEMLVAYQVRLPQRTHPSIHNLPLCNVDNGSLEQIFHNIGS